jgi:N6-adenosine-specific RNA methylase IME4
MMTAGENKGDSLLDGQPLAEDTACGVPNLTIDTGLEALIPPLSKEEYESLEKSLRAEGCREDIVVWKRGDKLVIVDGHHRYKLCRQYNIPFAILEKEFENADAAKAWMIRNQLARRNLTDYARCLLALDLEPSLRREAKERQREGGKHKVRQNSYAAIDVKKQLADFARVSHDTLNKVKVIREKATEQEKAELSAPYSKLTIHGVYRRIRQDELRTETPPFPKEKFTILYVDPPWQFRHTESANRAIENHYPTMRLEELKALSVKEHARDNCVLLLWAPAPLLKEAIELSEAWGFRYQTCAVWDKERIGMGYYFRQQHEHLLVATKGSPRVPLPRNRPPSVLRAPRSKHSQKPAKVYELIEQMYPNFEKIELFARPTKPRPGWTFWGNEVPKSHLRADTKSVLRDTETKEGRTQ